MSEATKPQYKYSTKRLNPVDIYAELGDYGRTLKIVKFTKEVTNNVSGEIRNTDLIEITATREAYDQETRETKVIKNKIEIDPSAFDKIIASYRELA